MIDVEKRDDNKTPLALAALMFFSPFIQNHVNKTSFEEHEKSFISGYIKLGYLNLLLLIITIASGVSNYFFPMTGLEIIYTISIGILLLFLLIGTICILSDVSLHVQKDFQLKFYDIGEDKKTIVLKYLPLYNIYLRYKLHSFNAPNRWVKESLLRWTLLIILMLTGSSYAVGTVIMLMILRIATLGSGIDILPMGMKTQLNTLFEKNPEELRSYLTGGIVYLLRAVGNLFRKTPTPLSFTVCREKERLEYSYLYNIPETPSIRWEYIVGIILAIGYGYLFRPDFTLWINYIPLLILIGRYLIMAFTWKHLPHLPLAREIIQAFRFLFVRRQHDVA